MNLQSLFDRFSKSISEQSGAGSDGSIGDTLSRISSNLPSGLAGGAVAGGVLSLLMTSKSARNVAGSAAKFGGAAVLGGLAYKAYRNWQVSQQQSPVSEQSFTSAEILSADYQLALIKAMIGAARADGIIDSTEHQRIFDAIVQMDLDNDSKAMVLDLMQQPISIPDIAAGDWNLEQRSELYLVSCMIIDIDHADEKAWLETLAQALNLPAQLAEQLQNEAMQQMSLAA